ncbi:MAG TPA: type I DNA topoisomerase [Myxococcales bacterium]
MIVKNGRFGRFLACKAYPECKTSKPLTSGVTCPECKEGQLAERKSKRGKAFWSCTKYPACKFAAWDKPLPEACPKCASPYLLAKYKKTEGEVIMCPNKECDYKRAGQEAEEA